MADTRIKTGKCRASYLTVINPKAGQDGGPPKYSVALLIPKKDTETVKLIKSAIKAAHEADKQNKNHLKGVTNPRNPLHDGDGEKPNGGAYGPECAGHWVLNTSSTQKPGLVDKTNTRMEDAQEWYSGIFVRADINFYAYNTKGNKGIAAGLNHLKKLSDGEALSGGGNPETAFDDDYEDEDEDIL